MSKRKPAFWIIRCDHLAATLARDGKFYRSKDPNDFQKYKTEGWAVRRLCRLGDGHTAYAVYAGDELDCCGRITRARHV